MSRCGEGSGCGSVIRRYILFRNDGETNDKFRVSFSMVWYILEMCIFKMFCEYIFCVDGLDGKMIGNLKGGGIFMEGKKDFPK